MTTTKAPKVQDETQGKDYSVDVRNISPLERAGGNIRQDYGDIDSLSLSIEQNGIVVPMRGFRNPEVEGGWFIIDGHRRLRAALEAGQRTGIYPKAKIIPVDARKISDEDMIFDMITTNSGKELTPIEMAEAVRRLIAAGWKPKDIAVRFGKNLNFVKNLELFAGAPKKMRDMVAENRISFSLVCTILKDTQDFNKAIERIEEAYGIAKAEKINRLKKSGKASDNNIEDTEGEAANVKITKRSVDKTGNRVDSFKELSAILAKYGDSDREVNSHELLLFAKKLVNNNVSGKDIEQILYK